MRGVLLDIIYSRDSYFATLREYTEEIALEDTFANDTQLYCLITRHHQFTKKKNSPSRGNGVKQNEGDESRDIVDDAVVFEFNQFVYHGSAQLPTTMLKDSVSRGFLILRAQPTEVAFGDVYDEILAPGGEHEAEFSRTKLLSPFASVHQRFQEEIGFVLLDLLIGAEMDGSEAFFKLELARGSLCPFAQVVGEGQALDLMNLQIWTMMVQTNSLLAFQRGSNSSQ
ncbi:hypothetical protein GN958_ATG06724 [Phytophthora infestans]|uniref:Uncharacterized protein n=1 Tax=Phytophthora infestans TaxID=4787 RepID=A0A8S9UY63_PHYIN|nr:hypothetical protein GN958_ATG06724 [Phytophthora infestans]